MFIPTLFGLHAGVRISRIASNSVPLDRSRIPTDGQMLRFRTTRIPPYTASRRKDKALLPKSWPESVSSSGSTSQKNKVSLRRKMRPGCA